MSIATIHHTIEAEARSHQAQLTKPLGALGKLEDIACWFAARQGQVKPDPLQPHITVFAADHGVTAEGVSAYPSVVTAEMVKNFARGGAAINVLARQCHAELTIVDAGVITDLTAVEGVIHAPVGAGTANLRKEAAMTPQACADAIALGRQQAKAAIDAGANLLIAGEMGIGNTTAAAAIICRLTGAEAEQIVGYGTGIDDSSRAIKVAVVSDALARVAALPDDLVLQQLGGFEIAAIAGFYLQAAACGVPVIIDGFITAAAALAACQIEPEAQQWMLASHLSQEQGHRIALQALQLQPLLDFNLRLGEGSGAALVVPLLQSAIALHNQMASFADAGVSSSND